MADRLVTRGPDDAGVWADPATGVALGHRRLSILDLSPAGHQPMVSASGRFVTVFNGEIYNFAVLRDELSKHGHRFRGHSDTEVLLAACEQWGVVEAIRRSTGMFAIVIWDAHQRVLHLVRDRLGEKPLYYGVCNGVLLFGSELKALRAHPAFSADIDRDALALFMRHAYIPAPWSIHVGIRKLLPGTILSVPLVGLPALPEPVPYWSAFEQVLAGLADPLPGGMDQAVDELDGLLGNVVAEQMVADVPLGAFLSGGIDSSLIVALMQSRSRRPVRTFSIGFKEGDYSEAIHAAAVAKHLGTDHTEHYVAPADALAVISDLPRIYDEPFADQSQIPTVLVSQMARRHVTVALTGDGGDELFGGYNRYFHATRIMRRLRWVPRDMRRALAAGILALSPGAWDILGIPLKSFLGGRIGEKAHKVASIIGSSSSDELYRRLVSIHDDPESVVLGAHEPRTAITTLGANPQLVGQVERMMHLDSVTYLPDDIMAKVDRGAMSVSLETRAPFLDHRIFSLAWRIPLAHKVAGNRGKLVLRKVLDRYVPRQLTERPKMGFGVPVGEWLRGPLREWAEALLSEERLRREGFLEPAKIRRLWSQQLSGGRNWESRLWSVLMFQAWWEALQRTSSQQSFFMKSARDLR